MIGINFQPGSGSGGSNQKPGGVQEAIKILSLRLPKVVGSQGIAPTPLLTSPGGGGAGSRVDSVVNSVLGRMFPTSAAPSQAESFGMAPQSQDGAPASMPNFGGYQQPQQQGSQVAQTTQTGVEGINPWTLIPRIIAGGGVGDNTPNPGGGPQFPPYPGVDGGGGFPSATIAPLPNWPQYEAPSQEQPLI